MRTDRLLLVALFLGLELFCVSQVAAQYRVFLDPPQRLAESHTPAHIDGLTANHTLAKASVPLSNAEALSYFDPFGDVIPMVLPSPVEIGGTQGMIYSYFERFTTELSDPVLDSIMIIIGTEDVSLEGQVRIDILKTFTSSGHFFPDQTSAPVATYYIDASQLTRDDVTPITIDCGAKRLGLKHFMISVQQNTLSSAIQVLFDYKTEETQRDLDDEIDRAYMAYVNENDESFYAFLGGMFMDSEQQILYPNMVAVAYLHQFGTETIPTEWTNTIAGSAEDKINSLLYTSDGGYLFVGSTNSTDGNIGQTKGKLDYVIGKFDKTGKKQWLKTFGGSGDDVAYDAIEFFGSKYVIAGSSTSKDGDVGSHLGTSCAWVITVDKDGNLLQSKAYGGGGDGIRAYSIANDNSSGSDKAVIAGWADPHSIVHTDGSFNHYLGGPWLAKLKSDGDTVWTQGLGVTNEGPVKHANALQVGTAGMIAFATENVQFEKTIHIVNAAGIPERAFELPSRALGHLAYGGIGTFATVLDDTLLMLNVFGNISDKFRIEGLSEAQTLEPWWDQGFVISGKSRRIGETIDYPSLFMIDAQGYTLKIIKLDTLNKNIVSVTANGEGYVLGRNDHPVSNSDIIIHRGESPTAIAPEASTVALIETCRGTVLDIPVTVSSGVYPIVASFKEGFGTPIVSDMVLQGPADGDEFVLHYAASQNTLINVRITDATGKSTEKAINITLGIPERPTVVAEGASLMCSVVADSYQWLDSDSQPIPLAIERSFTPLHNGDYAVRVSAKECNEVSEFYAYTSSSVEEQREFNTIRYISDGHILDLQIGEHSAASITIYDVLGHEILSQAIIGHMSIDLSRLTPGSYFARLSDAGGLIATKAISR